MFTTYGNLRVHDDDDGVMFVKEVFLGILIVKVFFILRLILSGRFDRLFYLRDSRHSSSGCLASVRSPTTRVALYRLIISSPLCCMLIILVWFYVSLY